MNGKYVHNVIGVSANGYFSLHKTAYAEHTNTKHETFKTKSIKQLYLHLSPP